MIRFENLISAYDGHSRILVAFFIKNLKNFKLSGSRKLPNPPSPQYEQGLHHYQAPPPYPGRHAQTIWNATAHLNEIHMHRHKDQHQRDDSDSRPPPILRQQQPHPKDDFQYARSRIERIGPRQIRRHQGCVKPWINEMIRTRENEKSSEEPTYRDF